MTTVIRAPRIKTYSYSEIFGNTFQGEGEHTGKMTAWLRLWGCNFECRGFGQDNPGDPTTWDLDFEDIDPSKFDAMEDLPVFRKGCDSSYSWAKKFQGLAHSGTAAEIVERIRDVLPGRSFIHPKSRQDTHMAFTGGEPMMSQTAMVDIMSEFEIQKVVPPNITIETNGTQSARGAFIDTFKDYGANGGRLFWSVSPKLYLSGESWDQAIQPDVVAEYSDIACTNTGGHTKGQLKYVCDGSPRSWDEVEEATEMYRQAGVDWNVWIMPVGADREMQESHQAQIAEQAIERGYHVAPRVHTWVFGNVIGK